MVEKNYDKFWILSVYFGEEEQIAGKVVITLGYKYFDGYKMPNVQRWLFEEEAKAKTARKFLKMIEMGGAYKKNFNSYAIENSVKIVPSIMETYI